MSHKKIVTAIIFSLALLFSFIYIKEWIFKYNIVITNTNWFSLNFKFFFQGSEHYSIISTRIIAYVLTLVGSISVHTKKTNLLKDPLFYLSVWGILFEVYNILNYLIFHTTAIGTQMDIVLSVLILIRIVTIIFPRDMRKRKAN